MDLLDFFILLWGFRCTFIVCCLCTLAVYGSPWFYPSFGVFQCTFIVCSLFVHTGCLWMPVYQSACGGQRTTFRSLFSPPTMWILAWRQAPSWMSSLTGLNWSLEFSELLGCTRLELLIHLQSVCHCFFKCFLLLLSLLLVLPLWIF